MTISELIVELQALKCEHGDLPVEWWDLFHQSKPFLFLSPAQTRVYIAPLPPKNKDGN